MLTTDTGRPVPGAASRHCPILGCSRVTRRSVPLGRVCGQETVVRRLAAIPWATALTAARQPMGRDERVSQPLPAWYAGAPCGRDLLVQIPRVGSLLPAR